uniref:BRI1 n=1 Tax=Arundo donax TaxID=35708 RepID=A0A0A9ECG4_ARUDO
MSLAFPSDGTRQKFSLVASSAKEVGLFSFLFSSFVHLFSSHFRKGAVYVHI